jgi:hypothetical protein
LSAWHAHAELRRLPAAEEMDDQADYSEQQENVDRSACDMECCPSNQPANAQYEKQYQKDRVCKESHR